MTSYKVLYDYTAQSEKEISLTKDDIISVLKIHESGWAEGTDSKNNQGWFPKDYVAPFDVNQANSVGLRVRAKEKKGKRMSTRFFSSKKEKSSGLSDSVGSVDDDEIDFSILDNKKKTSTYLTKWISNRNTKLKEKGLIDDNIPNYNAPGSSVGVSDTIYGVSLSTVLKKYGGPIPPIIRQCKEIIEKTSLQEVGIFRLSGVASQVNQLGKDFFTVGATPDLSIDCNAVAGALKKFFRELPEPLFTFEAHDEFLNATREADKVTALKTSLASLPRENYLIIHYLLKFLKEVSKHSDVNKMAASNLGIVFGPTLMRNKEESLSGMMNPLNNPAGTISALIENFEAIFGDDPEELNAPSEGSSSPKTKTRTALQTGVGDALITRNSDSNLGFKPPPTRKARSSTTSTPGKPARSASPVPGNSGVSGLAGIISQQIQSSPTVQRKPAVPTKRASPVAERKPSIPPKPVIPPKPTVVPTEAEKPPLPQKPTLPPKPEPKEYAHTLYDFVGDPALGQMSFSAGDKIEILKKHNSGWWTGELRGTKGLFPMNFVEVIQEY